MAPTEPISVLIVEDNEVDAELLKQIVERACENCTTDWCWNGLEALVRLGSSTPDLIILDYMMPKTDGMEFLRNVRALETARSAHIAVISAFVDPANADRFRELGADDVLAKPVQVKDVADIIRRARQRKSSASKSQ